MELDPPAQNGWAPPPWGPLAQSTEPPRPTSILAALAAAAWMSYAVHQWYFIFLLRRRTDAWRVVVEDGASTPNLAAARLADEQLRSGNNLGWFVVASVFLVGAVWAYATARNGIRLGVPDVQPGKIALQYAIPVLGIGYSIRQLARILATLRRSPRPLNIWLNTMFFYLFVWLTTYFIGRWSSGGVRNDRTILRQLDLDVQLSIVQTLMITLIAALAVRAILHTDRELRGGASPGRAAPEAALS